MKHLTDERISELIKQAIQEGKNDSRYYLIIKEYKGRDGHVKIRQVYGEYEMILMNINDADDNTREFEYAVIPKSDTVILLVEERIKYNSQSQKHQIVYVFNFFTGWKSLSLY
ncbi:hypothetical protein CCL42_gp03 [Sulfolobus islandicus rod-shaped virus 8]|uniref:Uncharacterized protein n=2 Tax=Usarudivirus TaxID=2843109 RepID=A0A1X9SJE2_9VIRU|nr:hypothetical protein CCL41_gp01 [Sulfolobus islandicus rod-shaped virus 9]YP_009362676.1 hypothetical protein CCL42_gp03 [Sulfolobus islandicus rod-shaped virus 8]ARQ96349.1 hypothetical protein [Sulfolobus islandicus rod-shaped virus 9]ARQ96409.1 hypothetical protein [Sulfolobus islandicus rod-shaped virus 8]